VCRSDPHPPHPAQRFDTPPPSTCWRGRFCTWRDGCSGRMATILCELAMRFHQIPLLLACMATPSLAQRPALGVSLGVNRSSVTGGEIGSDGDAGTGLGFGVSIRRAVSSWLQFEPELRFSIHRAGTRDNSTACPECPSVGRVRLRMTTAALPLLLRAALPSTGGSILPFLIVGPAFSVRLGCSRSTDDGAGGEFKDRCDGVVLSPLVDPLPGAPAIHSVQFQTWDLSLIAGAGIEIERVVLQARIERGLRTIERSIPFPMTQIDGSRLLSLALSVGVWLPSLRR